MWLKAQTRWSHSTRLLVAVPGSRRLTWLLKDGVCPVVRCELPCWHLYCNEEAMLWMVSLGYKVTFPPHVRLCQGDIRISSLQMSDGVTAVVHAPLRIRQNICWDPSRDVPGSAPVLEGSAASFSITITGLCINCLGTCWHLTGNTVHWPMNLEMWPTYCGPLRKHHMQEMWTGGRILLPHTLSVPNLG